ncbi:unnamed protein product [Boreogadus saida]
MALLFLCFLPCDFATAIARVCVWIATAIAIIFVRISSPNPFLPLLITPWISSWTLEREGFPADGPAVSVFSSL